MKKLNQIRNEFIHFTPKGWALGLSSAPQVALDCLDICGFLVRHSGRFVIFVDYREGVLEGLIAALVERLRALEADYTQRSNDTG